MSSESGNDSFVADSSRDKNNVENLKNSRFRFKSKRKSDHDNHYRKSSHRTGGSHHRHHYRTKRHKHSPSTAQDDHSIYDDTGLPNISSNPYLGPDAAFRESLFDAMADDEGAQFWEGVYGQPIHTYSNLKETPEGELERMTDEEYAAFVRAKMYEKTHQHLLEEKDRREEAKKERERMTAEGRKEERGAENFRRKMEESLKRGEERKARKAWADRWEAYIKKWEDFTTSSPSKVAAASIPWPVESGKRRDVELKAVERFFLYGPTSGQPTETQLSKILKLERVRWHPDKMQQKLGGQGVEEAVIQGVTEVFQIIDHMWSEMRDGKK